jgi:hypothetical protein
MEHMLSNNSIIHSVIHNASGDEQPLVAPACIWPTC